MAQQGFPGEFKSHVVFSDGVERKAGRTPADNTSSVRSRWQWKSELLERVPQVFEQDQACSTDQERITEGERLVGRLMMQAAWKKGIGEAFAQVLLPHANQQSD